MASTMSNDRSNDRSTRKRARALVEAQQRRVSLEAFTERLFRMRNKEDTRTLLQFDHHCFLDASELQFRCFIVTSRKNSPRLEPKGQETASCRLEKKAGFRGAATSSTAADENVPFEEQLQDQVRPSSSASTPPPSPSLCVGGGRALTPIPSPSPTSISGGDGGSPTARSIDDAVWDRLVEAVGGDSSPNAGISHDAALDRLLEVMVGLPVTDEEAGDCASSFDELGPWPAPPLEVFPQLLEAQAMLDDSPALAVPAFPDGLGGGSDDNGLPFELSEEELVVVQALLDLHRRREQGLRR
eukprot:g13856.t1